ncbi:MAG TPA: Hsp70 family protein [Planctomycetota bacterium]|nr:Hsp70 family protein [Planctomycetota bacterium]
MPADEPTHKLRKLRYMPLTLGIETLGGIATPLIRRGTPLPAVRAQAFSTASNDQTAVDIHVVLGESPIAERNETAARLTLKGIPPAPRGKPEIRVTFEVDEYGKVKASAREKGSGREIEVETDDLQLDLSPEKVSELLKAAELGREADQADLRTREARLRAEGIAHQAEQLLRRHQGSGHRVKDEDKLESTLAELGLALQHDDARAIRACADRLEGLLQQPATGFDFFASRPFDLFGQVLGKATEGRQNPPKPQGGKPNQPRSAGTEPGDKGSAGRAEPLRVAASRVEIGTIFGGGTFAPDPNLCFVLMPFTKGMQPVYDHHIKPVIEGEELTCLRADEIAGTRVITRDIWEHINRARLVVADLTGRNPNVFYELGLAHAIGKDVVLLTQSMEDVPFDLKALRCIEYQCTPDGLGELASKLRRFVRAVVHAS